MAQRVDCNHIPVDLSIVGNGIKTLSADVVDVSSSGLKVICNTRTHPGQTVRIKMEDLLIFAEVRHCRSRGGVFETGLQISNVIGGRSLCTVLTEKQVEQLVLDRGLSPHEKMFAIDHASHCQLCTEHLQATRRLFAANALGLDTKTSTQVNDSPANHDSPEPAHDSVAEL